MTREEAIAILENEKKCVNRANKNDYCNRDCYNCELVKTDTEILNALDMAIKELEQEPCEDAISRQAVLELAEKGVLISNGNYKSVCKAINELPPVTPKQRWIPVSEGLPEDFQRVLVTIVNYKGDKVVRLAEYYGWKRIFQIKENHEQWEVGEKGLLAWMSLPEPYRAEIEG